MNDYNYLVSVIVPNYCHSRFLDQRIDSILNQTYQNFELILLDDYSPDDGASKSIIEKYRDNPHVSHIVYNDVNSGSTFKQWDKGINLAKGDLVWIAESDDYCENIFLATLVSEFEHDENLSLAYSLSNSVDIDGRPLSDSKYKFKRTLRLDGCDFIRRFMTLNNHCVNASACLFRKSLYFNIDVSYASYKASGDWLFWIEIAERGHVSIVNRQLNYFRKHGTNVTQTSLRNGMTLIEFKNTYQYLMENIDMSFFRKWLVKKNACFLIERMRFDEERIREELFETWGFTNKLNCFESTIIRIVRILQRYSIYI